MEDEKNCYYNTRRVNQDTPIGIMPQMLEQIIKIFRKNSRQKSVVPE